MAAEIEMEMDMAERALGWLNSRISFSGDFAILHTSDDGDVRNSISFACVEEDDEFEFCLPCQHEKKALSAEDLFSQGMLKPLQWLPASPLPPPSPTPPPPPSGVAFVGQEYYDNDDKDDGNIAVEEDGEEISMAMMKGAKKKKKKKKEKNKKETELDLNLVYCGPGHMIVPMGTMGEAAWLQHFASKLAGAVLALRSSKASKRLKDLFFNLGHINSSPRASSTTINSPCDTGGCNSTTESNSSPCFVNLVPKRAARSNALSPPRFFNVLQRRAAPSCALFPPSRLGDSGENKVAPNSILSPLFTNLVEERVPPNSALCPPFTNSAEKRAAPSCAPSLEVDVVGLQKKNKGQSKYLHSCTCFPHAMITPETN